LRAGSQEHRWAANATNGSWRPAGRTTAEPTSSNSAALNATKSQPHSEILRARKAKIQTPNEKMPSSGLNCKNEDLVKYVLTFHTRTRPFFHVPNARKNRSYISYPNSRFFFVDSQNSTTNLIDFDPTNLSNSLQNVWLIWEPA